MRIVLLAAVILAAAPARAGNPAPSVIVTASASSALDKYPAWMVVDSATGDGRAWCTDHAAGATLTLTFEQPIPVKGLQLNTGVTGKGAEGGAGPDHVQVIAGTQTVDVTKIREGAPHEVKLDGSAVSAVTVKIVSTQPVKANRTCIQGVRVLATNGYYYTFLIGLDRAAMTALGKTAHELDAGLRTCDAKAIGAVVRGPVTHTHSTFVVEPVPNPPASKTVTYKSAAELVAACVREGSALASGFAGGYHVVSLDDDLLGAYSSNPGEVTLGDGQTHAWQLVWKGGAWSLAEILTSQPFDQANLSDLALVLGGQLDNIASANPPADLFAPGAAFTVVDSKVSFITAKGLGAALHLTDNKHDDGPSQIVVSRDGESAWASIITKYGAREFHVSIVLVKVKGKEFWQIAGGFWAEARSNAAVDKAAIAGKPGALALLPANAHTDDLGAAVAALAAGPIDKLAAARGDLVALGSGPGERTVGGRALAGPWAAAWAKHVTFGGANMDATPSGRTAWAAVDATLDKGKFKQPFRLFFIFDRAGSGAWTLVHAQFAVPDPA